MRSLANLPARAPSPVTPAVASGPKSTGSVQRTLMVGAADDQFEQQADATAAQVTGAVQRSSHAAGEAFAAPEGFAAVLARTTGAGRALDPTLRSEFEPAFGADFGGVRIHTGPESNTLAQTIQAKAFTHGQDIHFADGVYDTQSTGGKALIAHELTHTIQQGAAPVVQRVTDEGAPTPAASILAGRPILQRMVQRAIGFEFETPWVVEHRPGLFKPWGYTGKAVLIKDLGDGLKMETDVRSEGDSVIEMVLDPPVQENDPAKFEKVVKKFVKIGDAFERVRTKKDKANEPKKLKLSSVGGFSYPGDYRVTANPNGFVGNPQMSVGVALDRLAQFVTEANNPGSVHDENDAGRGALVNGTKDTTVAPNAIAEVQRVNGSDELKGLVTLLASYLIAGSRAKSTIMFNYPKLISDAFLSRTDFASIFQMLPDNEYRDYILAPQTFVDLVLAAASMPGTGAAKVWERGVRKSYDRRNPDYTVDLTDDTSLQLGVTRAQWLLRITLGEDLISSKAVPAMKAYFEGLGALGARTDRVGDDPAPQKGALKKGSGIILELRRMAPFQLHTAFAQTAMSVFDYIVAFNAVEADDSSDSE
ncbi:MAG: DUF4157 domain-containing protein [Caldilineaceae bacterium]